MQQSGSGSRGRSVPAAASRKLWFPSASQCCSGAAVPAADSLVTHQPAPAMLLRQQTAVTIHILLSTHSQLQLVLHGAVCLVQVTKRITCVSAPCHHCGVGGKVLVPLLPAGSLLPLLPLLLLLSSLNAFDYSVSLDFMSHRHFKE